MKFKIKEARERIGLSQKDLAAKLNIKPTTFNGYETGAHDPKSEILKKIAEACNTSVDFLLGVTENPEKQIEAPPLNLNEDASKKYEKLMLQVNQLTDSDIAKVLDYAALLIAAQQNRKGDQPHHFDLENIE